MVTMAEKHNKHMHVWQDEEEIKDGNILMGGKLRERKPCQIFRIWCVGFHNSTTFIAAQDTSSSQLTFTNAFTKVS